MLAAGRPTGRGSAMSESYLVTSYVIEAPKTGRDWIT
jgi:hypothetical protein